MKFTWKGETVAETLGYLGLVPLFAGLAFVGFGAEEHKIQALALFISYAALILSFLGGINWGRALSHNNPKYYITSIVPTLWAFASLIFVPLVSLVMLTIGFVALLAYDMRHTDRGWFFDLRVSLTTVVVLSLCFMAAQILAE
jgi:uncharacterized membrane protein YidH (DUF202 family)